ncbi:MAG TPA: GTP-binding protein [Candidatus Thermoplasmatota archaeon]|nr:GTP-binding protein [Candidatus Thermoplasmatota archaeon]
MAERFGVPPLDGPLGGIPPGGTLLLRHDPAVDGVPFLLQAAGSHLRAGGRVVYLTTNRPPSRVRFLLREQGEPDEAVVFLDAYSGLIGSGEEGGYRVKDPQNLVEVAALVDQVAAKEPDAILLVDSLSGLVDHSSSERFLAAFPRLLAAFRKYRFAAALHTEWPYGTDIDAVLGDFDAEVRLRGVEERVVLNMTFQVLRSGWGDPPPRPTLYKVVKPGGVFVHIPKIIVVGPHSAGKSTFVHTLAAGSVSVERAGTTVALDRGTATLGATKVELWGTPGQDRFDPLLPALAGQASGAILVLDALEPASFSRGKEMLQKVWRRGLKVLVALNKQDLPGAIGPEEGRRLLQAPPEVEVVGLTASDKASAQAVLQRLVDTILRGAP